MIAIHSFIHHEGAITRIFVAFPFLFLELHRTADAGQHMRKEAGDAKCGLKLYLNNRGGA